MSERDMKKLLELIEKHLGKGYLEIADWIRDQNSLADIEARIVAGDYLGAVGKIEDAAAKLAATIHQGYVTAGRTEAESMDSKPALADKLIRFDEANPNTVRRAKENEYKLVQGYVQEQREKTRAVLTEGLARGANPREMARDLRDGLGLTPHQDQHVRNYRRSLEQGDWSRALGYELSDGRTDRTVTRLQRDGGGLSSKQIDEAVDRYRTNYINHRAEVIARTEGLRAANEGSADLIQQAVERGDIEADRLVTMWHAGPATLDARPDHQELDGKTIKHGELFTLADGTKMKHPGDPAAGAKHVANCRCTSSTTIDDLADREKPKADPIDDQRQTAQAPSDDAPAPYTAPKNPKRVAAARVAAAASVERRQEIYSAARSNLPRELHAAWDKDGHKFMRAESSRIRGVKDRVNASSMLSQSFMEKYGDGDIGGVQGNEGDMSYRRAVIDSEYGDSWANEQERRYYADREAAQREGDIAPTNTDNDDPPF